MSCTRARLRNDQRILTLPLARVKRLAVSPPRDKPRRDGVVNFALYALRAHDVQLPPVNLSDEYPRTPPCQLQGPRIKPTFRLDAVTGCRALYEYL